MSNDGSKTLDDDTEANRQAWNAGRYQAWVSAFDSPEVEAQRIVADPGHVLRRLLPNLGEMSDEFYQQTVSMMERMLESKYKQFPEPPDLSNHAGLKPYADVVVGGKVVATIDNQGVVRAMDDKVGERIRGLSENVAGRSGPDLAQDLAQQIASLLGGRVVKSDTAVTQSQFDALPTLEARMPSVDYNALQADPEYSRIQEMKQKREEFLASQHSVVFF